MNNKRIIYLDNAATSWPKPEAVYNVLGEFLKTRGANPGRSGHRMAVATERAIDETRKLVADFIGAGDPDRIIFTLNCTDALNIAIQSILKSGDNVLTTVLEHNSVSRPLEMLKKKRNISVTKLLPLESGYIDPQEVKSKITKNTSLIVLTHASNVIGTVQPIKEIAEIARARGIPLLIDAAQTVGVIDINVEEDNITLLAFPAHKGLLGSPGVGCLYVSPSVEIEPLRHGGSGTNSALIEHPDEYPHHLEAGTPNTVGIAALGEGIKYLNQKRVDIETEIKLICRLIDGLRSIDDIKLHKCDYNRPIVPTVSVTVKNFSPDEVAAILDDDFGIACRAGLHCAPFTHKWLGTFSEGTVRFSIGPFNTDGDIDAVLSALKEITKNPPSLGEKGGLEEK